MTTYPAVLRLDDGLERTRVEGLRIARAVAMQTIYGKSHSTHSKEDPALRSLANTFSRYAQTQQTAYESGTANASASTTSNMLERQVQRAMSQVLGRGAGNRDDGFGAALIDTFPTQRNGKVTFVPARGSVQLSGVFADGDVASASAISAGVLGQISSEQATLSRQSALIVGDARRVLASLAPFAPQAETDIVESLRALVAGSLTRLDDEFRRVDEPRAALVNDYLRALMGDYDGGTIKTVGGQLARLGRAALLDRTLSSPATLDDEAQIAGFALLLSYAKLLYAAWQEYDADGGADTLGFPNFSERLARASTLLSVIAQGNANFTAAMDAIGFAETERRSSAVRLRDIANFDALPTFTIPPPTSHHASSPALPSLTLPDLTVYDLTDWIDRLAAIEGPRVLADSGQYGLSFVTLQADTLFWQILPLLAYTKSNSVDLNASQFLVQVLTHERVSWALDDLLTQLNALASLA
jgi:hypothetical protein